METKVYIDQAEPPRHRFIRKALLVERGRLQRGADIITFQDLYIKYQQSPARTWSDLTDLG